MGKQFKITEQTRKNLIKSFWKLYKKEDVHKITIGNICRDASYDRTTFYRYFSDIDDLLEKLEDEVINNIKDDVNKNINNNNTRNVLFIGFSRFNDKYGEYVVTFCKKGNNGFYNKFKKLIKDEVYNYFNFNIEDENKKEIVFEFMFASLLSSYSYWYSHKNSMPLNTFVEFANSVISNGVNTIINK